MVLVYSSRGVGKTVWFMPQSYNVKLLAMVIVYSGGGEAQSFLVQNCFLSPNKFHDFDHRALVLSVGQKYALA